MLQLLVTLQALVADRVQRDDKGATAVEYGLMVALISLAIIVAVTAVGFQLDRLFDLVVTKLTAIV